MHYLSRSSFPVAMGVLLAVAPTIARAQAHELLCVAPPLIKDSACLAKVPKDSAGVTIILRLVGPGSVAGVPVIFAREPGAAGSIGPSTSTGTTGLVETRWNGLPGAGVSHFVATATMPDGRQVFRDIKIEAALPQPAFELRWRSGNNQTWYEKRQLRWPLVLEVNGADSNCTGAVVYFRPSSGGSASPDSVYAMRPEGEQRGPCLARTYWRVGEGVGMQHITAIVRGDPGRNLTAQARVRALPRIGAGIAATNDYRAHYLVKDSSRIVRVTRKITTVSPPGDSTVQIDSVVQMRILRRGDEGWFTTPVVNVDFPLRARWHHARFSLGVSLKDPSRDWYVGFSPLQARWGLAHENIGVDLHIVMHAGRRRVLDDPSCRDDRDFSDCVETDRLFLPMGFGVSALVDGTSLLATLGSIFK